MTVCSIRGIGRHVHPPRVDPALAPHTLPVSELMTKTVVTCSPHDSVASVASTMRARNIRHIPVEESGRLVGMISIRDVLNHRTDDLLQQTNLLRAFASHTDRDPVQDR